MLINMRTVQNDTDANVNVPRSEMEALDHNEP